MLRGRFSANAPLNTILELGPVFRRGGKHMNIAEGLKTMLIMRNILVRDVSDSDETNECKAYLNAFLLSRFGIEVDKPNLLNKRMISDVSRVFKLNVPASFYNNPQDTAFFSVSELLLEQLVSYFLVESGAGIYDRVSLFKKELPEYVEGDEIKLRRFQILSEDEAKERLAEIAKSLCSYTRPFSLEEAEDFKQLYSHGFVPEDSEIGCKDNIISMLGFDVSLAKYLDRKDLVKLSVSYIGDVKKGFDELFESELMTPERRNIIRKAIKLAKPCPMTKKQAKYYNRLAKSLGEAKVEANSPHKEAMRLLREGDVVGAAKAYSKHGSLLERNLRMLLSRANPDEALQIMGLIKVRNPMVLYQLATSLSEDGIEPRTFMFTKNNLVKRHVETEYEAKWRKSRLTDAMLKFIRKACKDKVYDHYRGLPSLGKVYIDDAFYKIGVPSNTSASGKGIGVLPTGSRIPVRGDAIRTFVTWKGVYDIDAAITLIGDDKTDYLYFANYSSKPFGTSILFSGDCRGKEGTEYYDVKLEEMRELGYKYLVFSFHGYSGRLDEGSIQCGYQDKKDLNTNAWDPKNIEFQFNVKGDTRACLGFAVDLETKELIVLNLMVSDEHEIVSDRTSEGLIEKYLSKSFLEINMGEIASCRGDSVDNPDEADVVFSDNYIPKEGSSQKVIRTFDLEKLVEISSER